MSTLPPSEPRRRRSRPIARRVLHGTLTLHDIEDVEAYCAHIVLIQLREWRAHLGPEDYDDLITFIIETVWELSTRYDHRPGSTFSTYAGRIARLRIADWYRRHPEFGRSQARKNTEHISLEDHTDDGLRLGHTLASSNGDPGESGDPYVTRLYDPRDR